jgi:hypothetical protein
MDDRQRDVAGLEYLATVTDLLQRLRLADSDAGLWEAADFQWAWRREAHPTAARFWYDDRGPVAAAVLTEWGHCVQCDVLANPTNATAPWEYALRAATSRPARPIEIAVRDDDPHTTERLLKAGFVRTDEHYITSAMRPQDRPSPAPLPPGYTLRSRAHVSSRPHHMVLRNGESVAERLADCSLYQPELDLSVEGPDSDVVADGLFWADPVTGVGLVEPKVAA